MEGVNLLLINSKRSLQFHGMYRQQMVYITYFVGWVIPLIIVTISAVYGFINSTYVQESTEVERKIYGASKYQICWLSTKHYMRLGAAIIPIAFVITANTLIALHTAFVVIKIKREENKQLSFRGKAKRRHNLNEVKSVLLTFLLLTPVFGLSWILLLLIGR